jgi:hypothetical protein
MRSINLSIVRTLPVVSVGCVLARYRVHLSSARHKLVHVCVPVYPKASEASVKRSILGAVYIYSPSPYQHANCSIHTIHRSPPRPSSHHNSHVPTPPLILLQHTFEITSHGLFIISAQTAFDVRQGNDVIRSGDTGGIDDAARARHWPS